MKGAPHLEPPAAIPAVTGPPLWMKQIPRNPTIAISGSVRVLSEFVADQGQQLTRCERVPLFEQSAEILLARAIARVEPFHHRRPKHLGFNLGRAARRSHSIAMLVVPHD